MSWRHEMDIFDLRRRTTLAIALAMIASASPCFAEGKTEAEELSELVNLEQTVVTASRHAESIAMSPSPVSVLTYEDIRRSGAISIPEALRRVNGMTVTDMAAGHSAVWTRLMRSNTGEDSKMLTLLDDRVVNQIRTP